MLQFRNLSVMSQFQLLPTHYFFILNFGVVLPFMYSYTNLYAYFSTIFPFRKLNSITISGSTIGWLQFVCYLRTCAFHRFSVISYSLIKMCLPSTLLIDVIIFLILWLLATIRLVVVEYKL